MSIKKEKHGWYSARVHFKGNEVVFLADTWERAFKSASKFIWNTK